MPNKQASIIMLSIMLFSLLSHVGASEEATIVPHFGTGFDEVVIADFHDDLSDPRDLEFHPGSSRSDELWIVNRATDSVTIIHDTGTGQQWSEHREDSNRNHFMEEVSAIAFGAYHPEFDVQFATAQESRNTYNGQGNPNNFMGPALWPSSLNHFAVENQDNSNDLLGSHIDMLHESPYGMGIAHDSDNAYWYNDGYYGELVYYDFQSDHDTGEDDHSDGIVRRYTEILLTRASGVPGHMVLDKDSGILYISDTGANRVLWVNTDDTIVTTTNIMNDNSRMEPLEEYSSVSGMEWGVLDIELSRPSGIALDGDRLFVSQNGNGKIIAYDLTTDGKSATEADTVQTSAISIMGLEIGPAGHLYYVDNGRDEVIRMDPYSDMDTDGVIDEEDNCPLVANTNQENYDSDDLGDVCDEDDDADGILDIDDNCVIGVLSWTPSKATDHDMDGCADDSEDSDDDNDGIADIIDKCAKGELNWTSWEYTDYDEDGCRDSDEDFDDDNDLICDAADFDGFCTLSSAMTDLCPKSGLYFISTPSNDLDRDGCEDLVEDNDDDNDGTTDLIDDCPTIMGNSSGTLIGCLDTDGDSYADTVDEFPQESSQWLDRDGDGFGDAENGYQADYCPDIAGTSTVDAFGCPDADADGWSDMGDSFPNDSTQHFDRDGDGFGDEENGYQADYCPDIAGISTEDVFGCPDTDADGWSDLVDSFPNDSTQYFDEDLDGYGDTATGNFPDGCLGLFGLSIEQRFGCPDADSDGWDDALDAFPNDPNEWLDTDKDGVGDNSDAFPMDASVYLASDNSLLFSLLGIAGVVIVGITLVGAVLINRRRIQNPFVNVGSQGDGLSVVEPVTREYPPLPPEGLPLGWTIEQWAWYGEEYLRNR